MTRASHGDRFELLAAVSRAAGETVTLEDTVQRLLELVVPAFADGAALDAAAPGSQPRRLGSRASEGSDEPAPLPIENQGQAEAPVWDPAALRVPLRARGRTLGALSCVVGRSGRAYGHDDLRFAEVLAGRIALALDNAGLSVQIAALERRLEATLAHLAEAVLVRDERGRFVYANAAAVRLLGAASAEEVISARRGSLIDRFLVFDERGRRVTLEDLPASHAARGRRPDPMLVRNLDPVTGIERWLVNKATPVFGPEGRLSMVVSVIEDVTGVKRAELGARLLAQAGDALASSLDYEQALQRVAQLAVPAIADLCIVSMRGAGALLHQVAVAHGDPARAALLREFAQRHPASLGDQTGPAAVIRSGQSQFVARIADEELDRAPSTPERIALLRDLEVRSVLIVPLVLAGQPPVGALTLAMAESGRTFDEDHLALAEELGRRAAVGVENARLYAERSHLAFALQQSLLPPVLPQIPGFALASLYRAGGEQTDVGGDFYDVFEVPSGWMLVVGDVAGRGAEAAALTSLSRYTLHTAGKLLDDPVAAIERLNEALRERSELSLVSVCCALVREVDGEVHAALALAGHPQPLHVHRGVAGPAGAFAPVLGVYDDARWQAEELTLEPGDQLVFYTDGVIEAVGEIDRFGEDRLAEVVREGTGADDTVGRIERALGEFARGPQIDDTAILVLERVAVGAASRSAPLG